MPKIKEKYVDTGKVQLIFIDFPLDQLAFNASKTLHCLDKKKQIAFLDTIYETQSKWTNASNMDDVNKNLKEILITNNHFLCSTVQLEFEANSFLQHMVRIITGTLVEIGLGRRKINDLGNLLESGQRKFAGVTAPSHGLYSLRVIYPQGMIMLWAAACVWMCIESTINAEGSSP